MSRLDCSTRVRNSRGSRLRQLIFNCASKGKLPAFITDPCFYIAGFKTAGDSSSGLSMESLCVRGSINIGRFSSIFRNARALASWRSLGTLAPAITVAGSTTNGPIPLTFPTISNSPSPAVRCNGCIRPINTLKEVGMAAGGTGHWLNKSASTGVTSTILSSPDLLRLSSGRK